MGLDVVDESTVLFPRSFLLTKSVTQATKKILPGFVHILIVYHAVRRIIRKSTKLCFIFTSKLLYERSITHVSSTRSHFYVKFRLMYLVPICWAVGFSVIALIAWWTIKVWTDPGRIFLVACVTLLLNRNDLGKRTVDSSTTSSPHSKISVKRKFKIQLISSQRVWKQ